MRGLLMTVDMVGEYTGVNAFEDPENTVIWRYITFYQLVSILNRDSLYFCRLDRYDDPFEGSRPKKQSTDSEDRSKIAKFGRKNIFGNCWHINERESAAMWNQYGDRGVAIKSTVHNLRESFSISKMGAGIYKVNYIDYESDTFGSSDKLAPYFHKRLSYEHEQELRLLFFNFAPHDGSEYERNHNMTFRDVVLRESKASEDMIVGGYFHPFDLETLVEEIRIAPSRGDEFVELVTDEAINHGHDFDVEPSVLGRAPTF